MQHTIKIVIVDDHQLVRKGFRALLEEIGEVEIVGEAANGKELLQLLRNGARPHIVLMDYEMPVMNGLEAAEIIEREFLGIKVIMLTMLQSKELIQDAISKGVHGFLFKNTSFEALNDAIAAVAAGDNYFASDVALTLAQSPKNQANPALESLSEREIEVLRLIAKGLSSAEIGRALFISPRTVDTHRNNILQKLDVHGIAGLVQFAVKHRLG